MDDSPLSSSSRAPSPSPSVQLRSELRASIARALATRRPILNHLNADTTWLLSLPRPEDGSVRYGGTSGADSNNPRNRIYFHVLIDPWLRGGQSDVAKFFSQQFHALPSAVQTIGEVEDAIRGLEDVARAEGGSSDAPSPSSGSRRSTGEADGAKQKLKREQEAEEEAEAEAEEWIDAIVISHEFTDHMHRETLLEASPHVPVFATPKAASLIRSWAHFDSVSDIPRFARDWRASAGGGGGSSSSSSSPELPLPAWLGISRVAYPGADLLYYHLAIMIAFDGGRGSSGTADGEGVGEAEAVIYTPHGVSPENLSPVVEAQPRIKTLALLHGLQDIALARQINVAGVTAQLNLGAHNGLRLARMLGVRYWIGTHDEVKKGGGVVSWVLDRRFVTVGEAVERAREEGGRDVGGEEVQQEEEVRFVELGNGEGMILE